MVDGQNSKLRERCINLAGSLYLLTKRRKPTARPGLTVVNYHRISGNTFRKHLAYIASHYQVLSPKSFLRWLDDEEVIDKPSVVFSFDDAYLSFYEAIYPILKENDLSVFMFVPTGFIGTDGYFWEDKLEVALRKTNAASVAINGSKFRLYSKLYRTDFCERVLRYLRHMDSQRRDEAKNGLLAQLGVNITESDMNGYRFLDWSQILEMEKSGLVVFGSHTVNHENLSSLSDAAVRSELVQSKRTLEDNLGRPVKTFAYPYGGLASFDGRTVSAVKEAGYVCAFTTVQGKVTDKEAARFAIQRTMLFDYQNTGAVALKLDTYMREMVCETRAV